MNFVIDGCRYQNTSAEKPQEVEEPTSGQMDEW
jgi:hypothetical protein